MQVARELLNRHPIALLMTQTVGEALDVLGALDLRFLPVVDSHQRLVGTVTDRELWRACFAASDAKKASSAPVEAVMNRELVTLDPEADLAEIVDLMIDHSAPVVPIVDLSSKLLGVISYADVLRHLSTP